MSLGYWLPTHGLAEGGHRSHLDASKALLEMTKRPTEPESLSDLVNTLGSAFHRHRGE